MLQVTSGVSQSSVHVVVAVLLAARVDHTQIYMYVCSVYCRRTTAAKLAAKADTIQYVYYDITTSPLCTLASTTLRF